MKKNIEDIALNILYVPFSEKDKDKDHIINAEYISKRNFTRKIQVVLLKITDGEKWHFVALKSEKEEDSDFIRLTKSFSKLMRNISSNSHENHYCFEAFIHLDVNQHEKSTHNFVKNMIFVK